jgi:PhoH-like ATPase
MAKKTYILDTNVYLADPSAFKKFGRNDVVIPLKVLEEIDKHKKRQDGVGANARHTIRLLVKRVSALRKAKVYSEQGSLMFQHYQMNLIEEIQTILF